MRSPNFPESAIESMRRELTVPEGGKQVVEAEDCAS